MENKAQNKNAGFSSQVGEDERLKLKLKKGTHKSVWAGFGVFGIVGWSVVAPTLLGAALGIWLDKKHPQSFSWSLSFLITGLAIGCYLAWYWIDKENREMHQNNDNDK